LTTDRRAEKGREMTTFSDNFNGKRGDVIYGTDEDRKSALIKAKSSNFKIMDQYNNAYLPAKKQFKDANLNVYDKTKSKVEQARGQNKDPAQAYLKTLHEHPKSALDINNLGAKYPGKAEPEINVAWSNMIRKACKHGMDFILREDCDAHLHFILDTLSEDNYIKVIMKQREYGYVAYTYSELRYLYKNWERLSQSDRIHFYIKLEEVPAPWLVNAWPKHLPNTANPMKNVD
jgi:hypothetical protein